MLLQREYRTRCGVIHYWIRKEKGAKATLVFLPGLTADHHLFDKQIAYFEGKYSVFVWDAPGHAASWPFDFTFDLFDKAKWLLRSGSKGVAVSAYGKKLMHDIMKGYEGQQERYAKLAGHGFRILAEAMERDLPDRIACPALLLCGEKDHAGSCIRYNKAWHKNTGIRLEWIKNAGHNSNTDAPETVNRLIEEHVIRCEAEIAPENKEEKS